MTSAGGSSGHSRGKGSAPAWLNAGIFSALPNALLEVRAPEGPAPRKFKTQTSLPRDPFVGKSRVREEVSAPPVQIVSAAGINGQAAAAGGSGSPPEPREKREKLFAAELNRSRINIGELQKLSGQGIPDGGSVRALTWKLLLGYLPRDPTLWEEELAKKRAEYQRFRDELIINPSEVVRRLSSGRNSRQSSDEPAGPAGEGEDEEEEAEGEGEGGDAEAVAVELLARHTISQEDHPLSLGNSSVWNQFFQDEEVAQQIERDVKRTHPDMHFFNGQDAPAEENQAGLRRILFIFAKLNPGVRYVQGMNEVLAPLYWVFKMDTDAEQAAHAEADAFFCFVAILGEFRDHFCQQLDNSDVGIRATISRLSSLLRKHDEELWRHLDQTVKVNPQFYAFRWITLLLTQEFCFPDCLRLWDSLLSNPAGPMEILLRVCCAMLLCVRDRLLAGDFTSNLKLLQHFPPMDVNHIIATARSLDS